MPLVSLRGALATGLAALVLLLGTIDMLQDIHGLGWAVGLGCGVVLAAALVRSRRTPDVLGPADLVTLTRALLACAAAALVADALLDGTSVPTLVAICVTALVLDAVDGQVARRTGTTSPFGGRFDGEADAFLLLVLSAYVGSLLGWWVLAIGVLRYAFGLAGVVLPWMRAPLPFRYWRKVVTAVQGIVLAVAAADLLPRTVSVVAVAVALAILAESFGRDVVWLWRRRREPVHQATGAAGMPVT
jgi:phosphatidylglycerophosphate synthase